MTIHKVTLLNKHWSLKTEILPSDGRSLVTVYFRYNEPPTLSEYDFMATLPRRDLKDENYTLFVPPEKVKRAGDYYFGVLQSAHDIDAEVPTTLLNYTFDVRSFACYFWNETSLQWSSKGCRVKCVAVVFLTQERKINGILSFSEEKILHHQKNLSQDIFQCHKSTIFHKS